MALTAPQEAAVVMTAKSAEAAMPKRTSLPSMLPPSRPSACSERVAGGLGPVGDDDAGEEQHAHRGEDRPALALVADHAAEDVGERRAEREDRDHLDEVRRARSGSRTGCAALALKKPPPLVPSILMATCEATGPDGDGLLGAFERRGVDIGAERLRHALPDAGTA